MAYSGTSVEESLWTRLLLEKKLFFSDVANVGRVE